MLQFACPKCSYNMNIELGTIAPAVVICPYCKHRFERRPARLRHTVAVLVGIAAILLVGLVVLFGILPFGPRPD